ncbi:alpha/beta fold hydrolase [Streptomyces sp. NEAU-YJ-81]|uniref:alpha/beta fold hydrolase n=1 Tax=Streptomyces sp. NEAU-YJ-81 TaxID=2820288 RepID=UPI001ABD32A5|nr:alpha/beta hydrolase [Streptomyces sp. NEAU-YJ-81]MBO3682509.1 alpha/beta hydrolase [Streptomyces sp. NEAU-YJ-81]
MVGDADVRVETGTAVSADGTLLGWTRVGAGEGRPIVVCHGSLSKAQDWMAFAQLIAAERPVYLYDRRGRGRSPYASTDFAADAEVDDLATMVELAGPGAAVLGHSFGGGCALAFAVREQFHNPVVLYEPRHSITSPVSRGQTPELSRLVDDGDFEAAVELIITKIANLPGALVPEFRKLPAWQTMCETVNAFPRELRLLDTLAWSGSELQDLQCPALLLVGETSPLHIDEPSWNEPLRSRIPAIESGTLAGQGHFAFLTAPDVLASIVLQHLVAVDAGQHNAPR